MKPNVYIVMGKNAIRVAAMNYKEAINNACQQGLALPDEKDVMVEVWHVKNGVAVSVDADKVRKIQQQFGIEVKP